MKFERYRVVTWREHIADAEGVDAAHGWSDGPCANAAMADLLTDWGRRKFGSSLVIKSQVAQSARRPKLLVPARLRRLHGEVLTKSEAAAIDRRRLMLGRI
ncbi:MAG: hypothetical protein JSR41_05140 [Proteobacteria bacterium]|nr:hypothetical protein [Pseudomonadota bacterium]